MEYNIDYMQILKQNWYVLVAIILVCIGTIIYNIVIRKKTGASNAKFLTAHPDAAKLFLVSKALVTTESVEVHSVNGDSPERFFEGTKGGIYLIPGKNSVEMSYTYQRPGVLHKTVTTTVGPVTKDLMIEANKIYYLSYDRKSDEFIFNE